jgi:hypothetical protein
LLILELEINHLSYFLVSAFQELNVILSNKKEVNVATNGDRESIVDPEAVIKKLKEKNSSLEERYILEIFIHF